ncbi:MAG: hypothetical protein IPM92_17265 [Saprospiraceae bacterium]|nr:hypothetical protein [Saprospiraceae bacterium]
MKSKTLPYFLFLFTWLTFCSCVDRNDVRNEISSYHRCITICEENADPPMEPENSCENKCDSTWLIGLAHCLGPNTPQNERLNCLERIKDDKLKCYTQCRRNVAKIKADLKKCKMACIPAVNPH